MARLFDDASAQYLLHSAAPGVTTYPFTMACWFNTDTNTNGVEQCLIALPDTGASNSYHKLELAGSGDLLYYRARLAAATQTATASLSYSINTWQHACGVGASATSRTIYLAGGNSATSGSSVTPSGVNGVSIGRQHGTSPLAPMSGMIAEAAIWNIALTAEEVAILAKGYSPLFVRPANLVAYWPITGRGATENDQIGRFDLTPTNGPTQAAHPRIIYPTLQRLIIPVSAGAGTFSATAAVTVSNATCAGSASPTAPVYTATAAVTVSSATCAGAASFDAGTFHGYSGSHGFERHVQRQCSAHGADIYCRCRGVGHGCGVQRYGHIRRRGNVFGDCRGHSGKCYLYSGSCAHSPDVRSGCRSDGRERDVRGCGAVRRFRGGSCRDSSERDLRWGGGVRRGRRGGARYSSQQFSDHAAAQFPDTIAASSPYETSGRAQVSDLMCA